MSRRFCVLAAITLAATMTQAAEKADDGECTREAMPRIATVRPDVATGFAPADPSDDVIETANGARAPMGALEVLMVRKGTDGKLTFACVNAPEAAQRFLDGTHEPAANVKEK